MGTKYVSVPKKDTESGLEEFLLFVYDDEVWTAERADDESVWMTMDAAYPPDGALVVKAYAPYDWQVMPVKSYWYDAVIIGYHEARLTPRQEHLIRLRVMHYWDIPF